jgi:thioredoxin 1
MAMSRGDLTIEPARADIDQTQGVVLLEFGAAWCGICQAAQPSIAAALSAQPDVRHIKVADGRGQPLGRSFRVKLWPTLIALRDGAEIGRLVRPTQPTAIAQLLASASGANASDNPQP